MPAIITYRDVEPIIELLREMLTVLEKEPERFIEWGLVIDSVYMEPRTKEVRVRVLIDTPAELTAEE